LLARNGVVVLVSVISPYRAIREEVRCRLGNFIEVYVNAPINVCEQRDVKGLYRRFRAGEISGVAGIDEPYEPPISPKVECRTDRESIAESVNKVFTAIDRRVFQISEQLAVPVMPKKSDEPQRST
jgi:adenylylsulfate kinase-like enzyme